MKIFLDKKNDKDVTKYNVGDEELIDSLRRASNGEIDADLGSGLIKQRIKRGNRGKSHGCRGLIVVHSQKLFVLVHIFAKGDKVNISAKEKKNLLKLANVIRSLSQEALLATAEREEWRIIQDGP